MHKKKKVDDSFQRQLKVFRRRSIELALNIIKKLEQEEYDPVLMCCALQKALISVGASIMDEEKFATVTSSIMEDFILTKKVIEEKMNEEQ